MNARKPWSNLICIFYDFKKKLQTCNLKRDLIKKYFEKGQTASIKSWQWNR